MASPVVDVHCHTFNADDLPVRGFIERTFRDSALARLAYLLDLYSQGAAPGAEEIERLEGLVEDGAEVASVTFQSLEDEAAAAVEALAEEYPDFWAEWSAMAGDELLEAAGSPSLRDRARFVRVLKKHRLEITQLMVSRLPAVDLFTPALVDMEDGLADRPETAVQEQVTMQGLISRLSIQGKLGDVVVAPMIGFDPRREYRWRWLRTGTSPLDQISEAVSQHGFVGVKLYPPMGFKPAGNKESIADPHMALKLDGILDDLWALCTDLDIPVLAHGNASNGVEDGYEAYSHPTLWGPVLEAHPGLRVCIGHFGGFKGSEAARRNNALARLAGEHEGIFGDVSNHPISDDLRTSPFFERLRRNLDVLGDRVMFGSDWLMLEMSPAVASYFVTYQDAVLAEFGADIAHAFQGGNAMRFLFGPDGNGANRTRLLGRFAAEGVDPPPWLLSTQT